MKLFAVSLFPFILILLIKPPCFPDPETLKEIAVVNAKYDPIDKLLNKYGISYKKCSYSDLEKKEFFNKYRTIFFPCGVENTTETNVNILSRGTKIHSVSLRKDFLDVNEELIYKNIKSFIKNGGNAYFSDYSYKLLDGAFKAMEFYDNFPNIGISGQINLELKNNLLFFSKGQGVNADMPHPGWVVVKSIKNSEPLAVSTFTTIRNIKTSPIISLLKRGMGETIYTSYHKNAGDDAIGRFIIYQLSYKYLSDISKNKASIWEQNVNCTIIDSIREWENSRSYLIPINKGNNTIYFIAEKGCHQIDIFDNENNFITSKDSRETEFHININSDSNQNLIIKVYPSNPKMLGAYSIISACGMKIIPYYKRILYILFFIIIILALYWINKTIGIKKFSGRIRQK